MIENHLQKKTKKEQVYIRELDDYQELHGRSSMVRGTFRNKNVR